MRWVILPLPRASQAVLGMEAGSLRWFKGSGTAEHCLEEVKNMGQERVMGVPQGKGREW